MLKVNKDSIEWAINDNGELIFTAMLENGDKKCFTVSAKEVQVNPEQESTPVPEPDPELELWVNPVEDIEEPIEGPYEDPYEEPYEKPEDEEPYEYPEDEEDEIPEDEEPCEEPSFKPNSEEYEEPKCTVWVKDSLWGRDFEVSGDEWIWTRPTEHAYDVYIEGPLGTQIYPYIERYGRFYTTKEELTSRGPRIAFNKLQNIPVFLDGNGKKTLIGTNFGPGSSSAKGYDGYLCFKDEYGTIIKKIHLKYV